VLDSHDTARFRTVSGSRGLHEVGIGLQMTLPGVPMVFAGDELGLEGAWGEDARRTMPWDRPDAWDDVLLDTYRRLIRLRRSSDALARGGCRWAHVDADCLAYVRAAPLRREPCRARAAALPARAARRARARDPLRHGAGARRRRCAAPGRRPLIPRLEDGVIAHG
jgi:alpha-glucosidase